MRTEEGWRTFVDTDGSWTLPSGVTLAGGGNAGYMEQGGDSQTTFGAHGSVSEAGYGTVGAGYEYESQTHDGVTLTHQEGQVSADGFGAHIAASASETELETPDGTFSTSDSGVDFSGSTIDALEQLGAALSDNAVTSGAPEAAGAAPTASFDDDVLGTGSAAAAGAAAPLDPMGASSNAAAAKPQGGRSFPETFPRAARSRRQEQRSIKWSPRCRLKDTP